MFIYKKLCTSGNAKKALKEILLRANKKDLRFVIYNVEEGHVECASDEGGPAAVRKYELSSDTLNAIRHDANGAHAALAYNMASNEVYLLDAVPELAVANCLLLCVMNILVGADDYVRTCERTENSIREVDNYVTAAPRAPVSPVRDPQTGRFIRLEETPNPCNDDEILGHRFRLGRRF